MKFRKKHMRTVLICLGVSLLACVIQLTLLNLDYWKQVLAPDETVNQTYVLSDCQTANWDSSRGELVSLIDPILEIKPVPGYVKRVSIRFDAQPQVPYVDLFYTNDRLLSYDEKVMRMDSTAGEVQFEVNDVVNRFRIDLGDDAGVVLTELKVVINPLNLYFSWSVEVAVVLIYLAGKFLFSLQNTPDYGIDSALEGGEEKNDEA